MCDVCCRECGRWCKSFTKTERLLTLLEAILLVVFIGFLIFLVLHFLACGTGYEPIYEEYPGIEIITKEPSKITEVTYKPTSTLSPDVKCTWKPSQKTKATTHYYDYVTQVPISTPEMQKSDSHSTEMSDLEEKVDEQTKISEGVEETDGEEPEEGYEKFVMALVKINPMREVTFGCILTVVSEYWTLTAASCIDAIEEMDSLDSFVMMEGYGRAAGGAARAVADVLVHPQYAGANRSYDVAALRSAARLPRPPPSRAAALDLLLLTVGERLTILGYGKFRSIDTSPTGRSVRAVHIYNYPEGACAATAGAGAEGAGPGLRHLSRGRAVARGACAARRVCAGPLHARGLPCNYCAGSPLLVDAPPGPPRLLGLMADSPQCGVTCEPVAYVNLAALGDWVDSVIYTDV